MKGESGFLLLVGNVLNRSGNNVGRVEESCKTFTFRGEGGWKYMDKKGILLYCTGFRINRDCFVASSSIWVLRKVTGDPSCILKC